MSGVLVSDISDIRTITFDRPEHSNALHRDDIADARSAVVDAPQTTRALIFTGAGKRAFSGGVYLDSFVDLDPDGARILISGLAELMMAVRTALVPTLAVIYGACIGGAFELALACDLRVAASNARFGLPEIKLGIPSVIDAALLAEHVGLSMAREMILTGDLYDAGELDRYGMLNVVCAPEELEAQTASMVERVSKHTRTALASQRRLFELWLNVGLQEGVRGSIDEFASVFTQAETHEQIAAYRSARAARPRRDTSAR